MGLLMNGRGATEEQNAVVRHARSTVRLELKGRTKSELAKKAALVEKALGAKTAQTDVAQPDGSFTRTLTLRHRDRNPRRHFIFPKVLLDQAETRLKGAEQPVLD